MGLIQRPKYVARAEEQILVKKREIRFVYASEVGSCANDSSQPCQFKRA